MMWYRFIIISFLCVFFSEMGVTQVRSTTTIPELESSLETSEGVERIKILHQLAMMRRFSDPKTALENSEESLQLSLTLRNDSLIAESNYRIGTVSILQGDIPKAIDKLLDAQVAFNENGYTRREMSVYNALAALYTEMGEFDKASEIYFKTLAYSKENDNPAYEIFSLTRLGVIQQKIGDYDSSKRFLSEALRKSREVGNWREGTMAYTELGNLEWEYGDKDSAAAHYQNAIDWLKEKNSIHPIPSLLSNIGNIYEDQNRLEESLRINKEAISLADSLGNYLFGINGLIEQAGIYRAMGKFDLSNKALNESLSRVNASNIVNTSRYNVLNLLAENYFLIDEFEKAAEFASESSELAIENKLWTGAERGLTILIESEIELGRFSEAVSNQKQLMAVRDSIVVDERTKNIREFDARFRVNQKEQEIALLEAESARKSIIQWALIIGVLLVLAIAALIIRSQFLRIQRRDARIENEELKRKRLEQELEFKNKQLVTQSLNIVQKKELMMEMKEKVETFEEGGSKRELSKLSNLIDYSFTLDKDWHEFRMRFEEVHTNFYHVLKESYGELTPNELKLSALIKLNLSIKEMAAILGITTEGVKKARYRLRKKLNLDTEVNLVEFMLELEKKSLQYA